MTEKLYNYVPRRLKFALKSQAFITGKTLNQYCVELLDRGLTQDVPGWKRVMDLAENNYRKKSDE